MNPEIKERWITALRSGDYQQGTEYLHKDNQYCCLGVLCELAIQEGVVGPWEQITAQNYGSPENDYSYFVIGSAAQTAILPFEIMDWADINASGKYYIDVLRPCSLMTDNDEGKTFEEIAEIIKENF